MKAKVKLLRNTPEEEVAIQRGIDADPDTYELSDEEFKQLRPLAQKTARFGGPHAIRHVSDGEYEAQKRLGRPRLEHTKEHVNLRLDPAVLAYFRATGAGWQTRINATLANYVARRQRRRS